MRIQTSEFHAGRNDPSWQLLEGQGERPFTKRVDFRDTFTKPPIVVVALSGLDVDEKHNLRIIVDAEKVDKNGFDVVFRTWSNTKVYGVRVRWTAFGD